MMLDVEVAMHLSSCQYRSEACASVYGSDQASIDLHVRKQVEESVKASVCQLPGSRRASWEGQVKRDRAHAQTLGKAQADAPTISAGCPEVPMPHPAWAASAPALYDVSCTVSTASGLLHAPASCHAGKEDAPAASSSTELPSADAKALEGLSSQASPSMKPAYSMLAWDEIDPWLADCSTTDERAAMGAAAAVHVSLTSSTTAEHGTPPGRAAAAEPEALSSPPRCAADAGAREKARVQNPNCTQEQLGSAPELLALSRSQPNSQAVQSTKELDIRSVLHTDTSAGHGLTECTETCLVRDVQTHSNVDSSSAASSIKDTSGVSPGRAPVSRGYTSKALPVQLPSSGDDRFLASFSAQQPAFTETPGETFGSRIAMAQSSATAVWDKSQIVMAQRSLTADASTDTDLNRLQGYSDATVHISAAPLDCRFADAGAADGKHSDTAVSMPVSQTAATCAIHSLPGAVQQQLSGPFSLSLSSLQTRASSSLHKEASPAPHSGSCTTGPVLPNMICCDSVRSSSEITLSAQSCTQKQVKGQDVAVDRTMPSIWDLDM